MYRTWAVALAIAMVAGACGGDSTGDQNNVPTSGVETPDDPPEGTDPEGSSESESPPSTQGSGEDVPELTGSGTATLTIGSMVFDFTGLTCYYDEAAAEAYNDDDATFLAIASDGDETFWVSIRDTGIVLFEVAYLTGGSDQWHMIYDEVNNRTNPVYSVENGIISVDGGEFELIVDRQETETVEVGAVQADCG